MSLLETFLSHPREKENLPIAIISLTKDVKWANTILANHLLWLWSTQYARVEGVRPVVCADNVTVRNTCLKEGIDYISANEQTDITSTLLTVLDTIPNTCFFLMDIAYPVRARGVLRAMLAQYYTQDHPSSIIAPGVSLHNSDVFRATHMLQFPDTSTIYAIPQIDHLPITSSEDCSVLEELLACPEARIYDPWFTPQSIALVNSDFPSVELRLQRMQECDMYACLAPTNKTTSTPPLPYHMYFLPKDTTFVPPDNPTIVTYKIYPETQTTAPVWDVSTWQQPVYTGTALTNISKCLALLHLLYPKTTLVFDSFLPPKMSTKKYGHEMRERNVIFEKVFNKCTHNHSLFLDLLLQQKDKTTEKEEQEPETGEQPSKTTNEIPDYDKITVLHIQHKSWVDRLILYKNVAQGRRFTTQDPCTFTYVTKDYIRITWDFWGVENFQREENTNIWHLTTPKN